MPEGDTVHKVARVLGEGLEGRALAALWLRERGALADLAGSRVREVAPLGKHLLVAIGDHVLHVHLGMRGRWHRYRTGERWQLPERDAVVRLDADGSSFVCFRAARAELLRRIDVATHPSLSRIGPDLLAAQVDYGAIVERARRRGSRSAADLLLDQRVAAGIGNVYKSEVLFLERVHPETPAAALAPERVGALYRRARVLLRSNLGGWRRTTTRRVAPRGGSHGGGPRLWVYGRTGQPCLRCGEAIASARVGDAARGTWWCPTCQPRDRQVESPG